MAKKLSPKAAAARLGKKFGKDSVGLMGDNAGVRDMFETGLAVLDRYILGIGGCPWGRVIELFGDYSSGKTTVATKMLAGAQAAGGLGAIVDAEGTFEPHWARTHGVDVDNLIHIRPSPLYLDGEGGALHAIELLCESAQKVCFVLDSAAALKSQKEAAEGLTGDEGMAENARAWSRGLRILIEKLQQSQSTLIIINQMRSNIGVYMGPTTKPSGGKSFSFYTSVRLKMWRTSKSLDGGDAAVLGMQAIKSKIAPPWRKAELKLNFHTGFVERWNILNHAKDMKAVPKDCQSLKRAVTELGWVDLLEEGPSASTQDNETQVPEEEAGTD